MALSATCTTLYAGSSVSGSGHHASSNLNWVTNLETAKKQAKAENKPLLLYFTGSDWCIWCQKMDSEVFDSKEFQQNYGQKLVFVELDFPQKKKLDAETKAQNDKLAAEYDVQGFPTILILDPNGKLKATLHYEEGGEKHFSEKLDLALKS
jgi:thioredoxin-related protein